MKSNGKYAWVDIAKGIAISLVVLAHGFLPPYPTDCIYVFVLAVFFILGGLMIRWDRESFGVFFVRKSKYLLIPFVVYSVLDLVGYSVAKSVPLMACVRRLLTEGWVGIALWFIPVYYLALLICKLTPKRYCVLLSLLLIWIGGLLDQKGILLPWNLSAVPFSAGLMLFAKGLQTSARRRIELLRGWEIAALTIGGMAVVGYIALHNIWILDLCINRVSPAMTTFVGALFGSVALIVLSVWISRWWRRWNPLGNIGRNTYVIMALSQVTDMLCERFISESLIIRLIWVILIMYLFILLRHNKFTSRYQL